MGLRPPVRIFSGKRKTEFKFKRNFGKKIPREKISLKRNVMKNPLFKSSLFATPESFEELQEMIENYSNSSEKSLAYQVAMFTMNLCHSLVEKELEK